MQTELKLSDSMALVVDTDEDAEEYSVTLHVDGQERLNLALGEWGALLRHVQPDYVLSAGSETLARVQTADVAQAAGESVLDADDHTVHAWLHERLRKVESELYALKLDEWGAQAGQQEKYLRGEAQRVRQQSQRTHGDC